MLFSIFSENARTLFDNKLLDRAPTCLNIMLVDICNRDADATEYSNINVSAVKIRIRNPLSLHNMSFTDLFFQLLIYIALVSG